MIIRDSSYIGGKWCPAGGSETFEVTDSSTGEIIGRVTAATAADADAAVAAARAAFPGWAAVPAAERVGYLKRAAEELQLRQTEIATLVSREVGMPFAYSNVIQADHGVIAIATPMGSRTTSELLTRSSNGKLSAMSAMETNDSTGRPAWITLL